MAFYIYGQNVIEAEKITLLVYWKASEADPYDCY